MTLHASAHELLATWAAPTPEQGALRDRYVAHLAGHPDGCLRSCRPDHLTAGALVLSADASLADGALREASEESGVPGLVLDPDPVHLDEHAVSFCGAPGVVHHLDVRFLAVATPDAVPVVSEESTDVRWWPVDALPDASLAPLVAAALAR